MAKQLIALAGKATYFVFIFLFCISPLTIAHEDAKKTPNAMAPKGILKIKSNHDVSTTTDRLETLLRDKGMTVFSRIDHAAGAQKVDKELRPTELIVFGNPKVGTPLMQCAQTVAIDLPQKMLIWEDAQGHTWLGYNDPNYLAQRHDIRGCEAVIQKISQALQTFANAAAM